MARKITKKEQFIEAVRTWNCETEKSKDASEEMQNLCWSRPEDVPFYSWVKQTDWTLGAIVAFFRWHCVYLNGGMDWSEFENYWECFKTKIYPCFE